MQLGDSMSNWMIVVDHDVVLVGMGTSQVSFEELETTPRPLTSYPAQAKMHHLLALFIPTRVLHNGAKQASACVGMIAQILSD